MRHIFYLGSPITSKHIFMLLAEVFLSNFRVAVGPLGSLDRNDWLSKRIPIGLNSKPSPLGQAHQSSWQLFTSSNFPR